MSRRIKPRTHQDYISVLCSVLQEGGRSQGNPRPAAGTA